MDEAFVIALGREALWMVLLVGGPILGLSLATGLLVSVFQATTQINEQTLGFAPKIVVVFLCVLLFGPWMLRMMVEYSRNLLLNLPNWIQ